MGVVAVVLCVLVDIGIREKINLGPVSATRDVDGEQNRPSDATSRKAYDNKDLEEA